MQAQSLILTSIFQFLVILLLSLDIVINTVSEGFTHKLIHILHFNSLNDSISDGNGWTHLYQKFSICFQLHFFFSSYEKDVRD